MIEIANRIKKMRKKRGMTQQDLADALGFKSRSSINKIEKDTYNIGLETPKKIAKALDCDPDYLAFGNEEDKKEEINLIFDQLSESQQDAVLRVMRSMLEEGQEPS